MDAKRLKTNLVPMARFLFAGMGFALGQAPFGLLWLALPALLFAFWAFVAIDKPFLCGLFFGLGYFAVSFMWIVEPFYIDAEIYGWMAPFAFFLMSAALAFYWAIAFKIAAFLKNQSWGLALCLSGMEILRGIVPFGGLAWNPIAAIWLDSGVEQAISVWGVQGLGLLTMLSIAAIAQFIHNKPFILRLQNFVWGGVFIYLIGGVLILKPPLPEGTIIDRPVRIVQPNIAQHLHSDSKQLAKYFKNALRHSIEQNSKMTAQPVAVIWPEGTLGANYQQILPAIARVIDAPFFLSGVTRIDEDAIYNSITIAQQGTEIAYYDKYHLVPFGEYIPGAGYFDALNWRPLAQLVVADYGKGAGQVRFSLPDMGTFLPLICFEAAFPLGRDVIQNRPDWILNVSNDAWFGDWVGPYQHLAQARLRTIELGLPMLRAANTGISAVIDARGQIIQRIDLNESGYIDSFIPMGYPLTIYSQTGEMPVRSAVILAVFGMWYRRRKFLN